MHWLQTRFESRSDFYRWPGCLVAPIFVLTWYLLNGYQIGTGDHGLLTPMVERIFDGQFLADDYLNSTVHPTLLWYLYVPFIWLMGMEWGFFVMHALCLVGLACSVYALAAALLGKLDALRVSAFALLALAPMSHTFACISTFDELLLPRVVSLAPLLFALAAAIQARFVFAFILAGITFNIHPTTAAHGAVIIGGLWLASGPRLPKRWLEPLAFVAAAAPLLFVMGVHGAGAAVPTPYPQEWVELVEVSWAYHHFPAHFFSYQWVIGPAPWLLWLASRSAVRSRAADIIMISIPAFCVFGWVLIRVARLPQAIALHVFESTRFAHYVVAVLIAAWLTRALTHQKLSRALPGLLAAASFLLSILLSFRIWEVVPSMFFPLGVVIAGIWEAILNRRFANINPAPPVDALPPPGGKVQMAALLFGVVGMVAFIRGTDRYGRFTITVDGSLAATFESDANPELDADARLTDLGGLTVMRWARTHLPEDSLVAIPPVMWHPMTSFRVVARRMPFVTWKDGSEVAFSVALADEWRERMTAVGGESSIRPLLPYDRNMADRPTEAVEAFGELDTVDFESLRDHYQVTHAIRARESEDLDFRILHQDTAFRVYELTGRAGP